MMAPYDPNAQLAADYQAMLYNMRAPGSGGMMPAPPPPTRVPTPAPQQNPGPFPPACGVPYYGPGCYPYPVHPEIARVQALIQQWQCQQGAVAAARGERTDRASKQAQIPLGGRSGSINAGASGTITITPTIGICPRNIEIPEFVGSFFLVTSVSGARQELLGNATGVSAESFRPDATNLPRTLDFPQLLPGQDLVITFLNIDAAAHEAFATLWAVPLTAAVPCLA